MYNKNHQKAVALIALIILLTFAAVAVFGVTTFVAQRLMDYDARQRSLRCIYNAQAGAHSALYFYRFRKLSGPGYFSLGITNIDAQNNFTLSATAGDLLMVDTSGSTLSSGNRNVSDWDIQNATNSNTITIATMTVSWINVSSNRRLQQVHLGNGPTQVWPAGGGNGSATSGTVLNINDFTLDAVPTLYTANFLRFNNTMLGGTITVTFTMTDNSTRALTLYAPAPFVAQNVFTVRSTGKTANSNIYRKIKTDYNDLTGKITDYEEIR